MRPAGWPEGVEDPDSSDLAVSAQRWLWEIGSLDRRTSSVWALYPVAHAYRVACDIDARLAGARDAYSRARAEFRSSDIPVDAVLEALEEEGAQLQRLRREVLLVEEALKGRRWGARL